MSAIGDIVVNLVARTKQFTSPLTGAVADLQSFAGRASSLVSIAGGLTAGLSVAGASTWGVGLAVQAEQAQIAFKTMLGSAAEAKGLLGQLSQFAATTPYESPEVVQAAKQLLAYGVQANSIIPTLRQLGDVASGVGAPIGDLAYLFGTAKTQGRLFSQDINQFTNRGIPIIKSLAETMSVAEGDVKKMVEAGKVGFPELQNAFTYLTRSGSQFGGMMAEQSQSIGGMWSTLKDGLGLTLRQIAEDLFAAFDVRGVLEGTISAVSGFQKFLADHRSGLQSLAGAVKLVATAFGFMTVASAAYAATQRIATISAIAFQAVLNPANLIKVGASLAAAGLVVAAMDAHFSDMGASAAEVTKNVASIGEAAEIAKQGVGGIAQSLGGEASKVDQLIQRLKEWRTASPDTRGVMPDLPNVFAGEKLFPDAAGVSERVRALQQQLVEVRQTAAEAGSARAAINGLGGIAQQIADEIGVASGIAGAIATAKRELESLGEHNPQQFLDFAKFRDAGATDDQLAEYQRLQDAIRGVREEQERLKEQQQARSKGLGSIASLKDEIDLLKGSATAADIELRKLQREGVAPDQLAELKRLMQERDALEDAKDKQSGKSERPIFAAALTQGSSEALAAINAAKYGNQTQTAKLEEQGKVQIELQREMLTELKAQNGTHAGDETETVYDF